MAARLALPRSASLAWQNERTAKRDAQTRRIQLKLVISDVPGFVPNIEGEHVLYTPGKAPAPCIGCFQCWTRTPGKCAIRDGFEEAAILLGRANELICVSECCFGSFSPFVKGVLDRMIPYAHPFFEFRNGEMHHRRRYGNVVTMSAHFYGHGLTFEETQTARDVVAANVTNYDGKLGNVLFYEDTEELREVVF